MRPVTVFIVPTTSIWKFELSVVAIVVEVRVLTGPVRVMELAES